MEKKDTGLKITVAGAKFVDIEVGEENGEKVFVQFYAENDKQRDFRLSPFNDDVETKFSVGAYNVKLIEHTWERIKGDVKVIESLKEHFQENGGFDAFIANCESELGKLRTQA